MHFSVFSYSERISESVRQSRAGGKQPLKNFTVLPKSGDFQSGYLAGFLQIFTNSFNLIGSGGCYYIESFASIPCPHISKLLLTDDEGDLFKAKVSEFSRLYSISKLNYFIRIKLRIT